jgi:dihydrofolate synthase / folylpolyglutamate synthase
MTYQETLDYLYTRLPMYQRVGKAAYKADLSTTIALDDYFGRPHKLFSTVHVAGTNGKGSVSHMLASTLQDAGYKTGLYTSPHMKDFRERIKVNGHLVTKEFVVEFTERNRVIFEKLKPSFFEMTVAMAFDYFAGGNVDIAVIETGMGGRLDSTNIISPLVSVITNIGMDHTEFLGNTLPEIAREKAGIIKPGVPVVIGERHEETEEVFINTARLNGSEIVFASDSYRCDMAFQGVGGLQSMYISRGGNLVYERLETDLLGFYQKKNVVTALQTIDVLKGQAIMITKNDIYSGLKNVTGKTGLTGRWQIIGVNPPVICDTAHNPEGIRSVLEQARTIPFKKLHIVAGFVNDKNIDQVLSLFPRMQHTTLPRPLFPGRLIRQSFLKKQ